ncbi:MAG TPA: DUF3857 and transglutaminase domain-containing protein [Pyrinomonadaceae bacterium]|nr:DUF3857 and transglutaminase domain-containing protein [Pyrinomonadaceae bacterium]
MKVLSLRKLLSMLSFVCLCVAVVQAQDKEWRPVSPADLASKTPVVESGADAEAIFWEVRIDDSSDEDLSMRHYVRVKIFTERGRETYSKFDIPFLKGVKIKDLAARVVRPDGTSVEIGKEEIFEREIIKAGGIKIKAKSFAVPNIEPGVIVEYRYKEVRSDSGAKGMRLAFQREIPVQTLSYYYKPYNSQSPNYQSYNFRDTKFVKDEKGFWLATKKNVPSFREEPQMPPEDMVRPYMLLTGTRIGILSASESSIRFTIKDPSNPGIYWAAVSAEQAPLVEFMNKKSGEIKKAAADITAGATTPEEKLRKIYEFCQTQIKNTTFDTTLTDEDRKKLPRPDSVADVLKRKSGAAQYVDLLFGALANAAELEPRIAFTGNRSEKFFKPEMTDEHLIHPAGIAVKVGDSYKFFNPGVSFLPYGMMVWYEEDTWALLVGAKNFSWQITPLTEPAQSESKRSGKFTLMEDGALEGSAHIEYTGHTALTYRLENYDESPTKLEENLKNEIKARFSTAEISEIKIENLTDPNKPLVHEYKIKVPGYAQKTGKRLFLQPGFFEYGSEPMFSSATRKYDVAFRYPWSENDKITVALPPGYDLDNADAPGMLADPQKISSLDIRMSVDKTHNTLMYDRKFFFGGGGNILFPSGSYTAVKNLFDSFQKSEVHAITLKQK